MKIQSMQNLKKEMLSVARGERKAPADAAQISSVKVPNATTLKAIAEPKPPHP